jgi:E3 ubiquitin-protein ligase RAD18
MLKEGALRKKLQEIGIPNWGTKDLLKRRHVEWLNIYNSNCDAEETVRKSKRQLLKELEEWENTQGGRAETKENKMMRKDFDGTGYAKSHKNDFDDLIAKAREKRGAPTADDTKHAETSGSHANSHNSVPQNGSQSEQPTEPSGIESPPNPQRPYENNESALSTIRAKVAEANQIDSKFPPLPSTPSQPGDQHDEGPPSGQGVGMRNPLGSPARKVPMFALPEQPVRDVDSSTEIR